MIYNKYYNIILVIKLKKYKSLYINNDIILIIIKYNIDFDQY